MGGAGHTLSSTNQHSPSIPVIQSSAVSQGRGVYLDSSAAYGVDEPMSVKTTACKENADWLIEDKRGGAKLFD